MQPIDTTTGLQCGQEPRDGTVEVVVGYLVTLPGGHECRLPPDRGRAEQYAARNHGTVEPMLVRRQNLPTHPAPSKRTALPKR
jgi:hypothetical protein